MKIGSVGFELADEITNISASPAEVQMLYHVNFGQPLLDGGSQVVVPVDELVPRNAHAASSIDTWSHYAAETPGFEEQVYFASLLADSNGQTQALLKNAHGTRGALLKFNARQLPCLSVWKNTTSAEDGFVTGIEPGTNYPNPRTFEGDQGRVIALPGKGSVTLNLGFEYCSDAQAVANAESATKRLQSRPPKVHPRPLPSWCA